jgi:DNA polymerase III alpha subunit
MTLEDETGVANAIVWKKVFEKYRAVVMGARLVKIHGKLQSHSGVIHTVVEHIEDMTPLLGMLQRETRRFGVSERSDEVLRSTQDHRQQKEADILARDNLLRKISERRPSERARDSDVAETASVMPRGRNFH